MLFQLLLSHTQSLEEQFSAEEGYRICRYDDFKFNPGNDATEPHIKVMVPSEHSQCVIGMEPMAAEVYSYDIMCMYIIILILHLSVRESGRSREASRPELKSFLTLHRWTWTLQNTAH